MNPPSRWGGHGDPRQTFLTEPELALPSSPRSIHKSATGFPARIVWPELKSTLARLPQIAKHGLGPTSKES